MVAGRPARARRGDHRVSAGLVDGHLILASSALGLDHPEQKSALAAFEIVIQGGAILAVLGLYASRVAQMVRGAIGRDRDGLRLLVHVALAFVPAVVLGPLLDDAIDHYLFRPEPVLAALVRGRRLDDLDPPQAARRPQVARSSH
jgi:undecaprenyl pyrophosphate phosphatase UppP